MKKCKYRKILDIAWLSVIFVFTILMLLTSNREPNVVAPYESRYLSPFPDITQEGYYWCQFPEDFDGWINDNIGFRTAMIEMDAEIQYLLFRNVNKSGGFDLGPRGEFNWISPDWAHLNLYSIEDLERSALDYHIIGDWLEEQNIQFYYMQCRNKDSVYPEQYPAGYLQYGDKSKTDQIVENLQKNTDVWVVDTLPAELKVRDEMEVYGTYYDPTHWTPRGANIGYLELMRVINEKNGDKYRILNEEDYNITISDGGAVLFGGIHHPDYIENIEVKEHNAVSVREELTLFGLENRSNMFRNKSAGNDTRILIIGDSYIANYILDDIAESFYETIMIWGDWAPYLPDLVMEYKPDILVVECAERCDRTGEIFNARLFLTGEIKSNIMDHGNLHDLPDKED